MRAVVQRVKSASVIIEENLHSKINKGIFVLLGVEEDDTDKDINYIADKLINLRIFPDEKGNMNLSVKDINGEILVVSQFTLLGDCRKGRRPSFVKAGKPDSANMMYENVIDKLKKSSLIIKTGVFQAMMDIELINYGPVTLLIDSKKTF